MANDRGVLTSDGIVLYTDAVSNCVERSHSAVTNSVSVCLALLHCNKLCYDLRATNLHSVVFCGCHRLARISSIKFQ